MNNLNIFFLIKILWSHIRTDRRKLFFYYLLLTVISAFTEILTLGSIIPFLTIFINPEILMSNERILPFLEIFKITNTNQLFILATSIFCFFVIFSGFIRIVLLKFTVDISVKCGSDLSVNIYQKTLNQSYLSHIKTNSSKIIAGISQKLNDVINGVLWTFMNLLTSLIISILIIIFLIYLKPLIAIICFIFFGTFYIAVTYFVSKKLKHNSNKIDIEQTQVVKSLQEGLGNIRDVILGGTQKLYVNMYKNSDYPLRKSIGNIQYISVLPKYIIESFGLVMLALFAYFFSYGDSNFVNQIPILGALALGAQKLLPSFQLIYYSFSRILGTHSSLIEILNLLNQKNINTEEKFLKEIIFQKHIKLKNIYFSYDTKDKSILRNINFKIIKGSIFGIFGKSGAGKSTLIDIIAGLLSPKEGSIIVDEGYFKSLNHKSWQKKISYVPQNIFLSQSSFLENIAFGIKSNDINLDKVIEVSKKAQIYDYINSTKNQFETVISESGFDLSGGQRQRIAIARALYSDPEILILDEFTSLLDFDTENKLMNMVKLLKDKMTIIIVSHKKSTLDFCDNLILIESGKITTID